MNAAAKHAGHDVWPLFSRPGVVWCRTCQEHYAVPPLLPDDKEDNDDETP